MQTKDFTTGSLPKCMLAFVGPYLLSIIVQNLYGAVDLLVVGHFATTADVSAVTVGSQIMSMATQFIIGFATGATVLIGKFFGAKDGPALTRTLGTTVLLFGGFAVVLTACFALLCGPITLLMQTPEAAVAPARQYIFACSLGLLFVVGFNVISSVLMGLGDSRTPFIFVCIACVINIVLDVVLVRGFGMGALGAAIATTAAQAGSVIFSLIFLRQRGLGFAFSKKDIRLDRHILTELLKVGTPVAVQNALVSLSFLFITAIINQMGLVASAAVGVTEKLFGFLIMPAVALSAAVATASAQNLGAGHPERASQSLKWGILMALIPSVVIVVVTQFAGALMAQLFTPDMAVVAAAEQYLRSYVVDCLFVSFVFCMNGYLNSNGDAWFTLLHSLLSTFLMRVPLSWLFSRMSGGNLLMVGLAAPLATLGSLVLCLLFFAKRRRQNSTGRDLQEQAKP